MCVLRAITSTKYAWVSCYHARQYLLVLPHNKKGVVYWIPWQDCDKVYIGETGRTLHACQKEHKRHLTNRHTEDSAVAAHAHRQLHDIDWENTSVLDYDDDYFKRKVKEALRIKQTTSTRTVVGSQPSMVITLVKIPISSILIFHF